MSRSIIKTTTHVDAVMISMGVGAVASLTYLFWSPLHHGDGSNVSLWLVAEIFLGFFVVTYLIYRILHALRCDAPTLIFFATLSFFFAWAIVSWEGVDTALDRRGVTGWFILLPLKFGVMHLDELRHWFPSMHKLDELPWGIAWLPLTLWVSIFLCLYIGNFIHKKITAHHPLTYTVGGWFGTPFVSDDERDEVTKWFDPRRRIRIPASFFAWVCKRGERNTRRLIAWAEAMHKGDIADVEWLRAQAIARVHLKEGDIEEILKAGAVVDYNKEWQKSLVTRLVKQEGWQIER